MYPVCPGGGAGWGVRDFTWAHRHLSVQLSGGWCLLSAGAGWLSVQKVKTTAWTGSQGDPEAAVHSSWHVKSRGGGHCDVHQQEGCMELCFLYPQGPVWPGGLLWDTKT